MAKRGDSPKNTAKVFKPYQDNMNLMIAVCGWLSIYQKDTIASFDKKYRLIDCEEIQKEKPFEWTFNDEIVIDPKFLHKLARETREDLILITKKMVEDFKNKILSKVNLPFHFRPHLWNFVAYGDVNAPGVNFSITHWPIGGKVLYASLNVYSHLSVKEKTLAFKLLERLNSLALPKSVTNKTHFNDSDLILKILDDATRRRRSKKITGYRNYLDTLNKAVKRGDYSLETFKDTVKKNPHEVVIEIEEGFTSDDIARKYKISSGDNVKKILERFERDIAPYIN